MSRVRARPQGQASRCRIAAQTDHDHRRTCAAAGLGQHGSAISAGTWWKKADQSGEFEDMSVRQSLLAAAKAAIMASVLAFAAVPASAQTLRYANQGDLKSLDPYTLKETTTIAHHGHIYEGLITRDKDLKIIPALAESWETPEPTR